MKQLCSDPWNFGLLLRSTYGGAQGKLPSLKNKAEGCHKKNDCSASRLAGFSNSLSVVTCNREASAECSINLLLVNCSLLQSRRFIWNFWDYPPFMYLNRIIILHRSNLGQSFFEQFGKRSVKLSLKNKRLCIRLFSLELEGKPVLYWSLPVLQCYR
jgi:hypothetical protein